MFKRVLWPLLLVGAVFYPAFVVAADIVSGAAEKQPLNITAITLFLVFVFATLIITAWAARRTHSAKDFYAAGGTIPAWQNGIAISGDFLSAATFLGISGAIFSFGFDGLLFIVGVLAGWPIILFLIAEPLRNLGSYTFIDVVSFRLKHRPICIISALCSLVVIVFYLIGQLVGAGKLIQLLFGLEYVYAVIIVGVLMIFYVMLGGMLATTWVQFIKAILLILGGTIMAFLLLKHFDFHLGAMLSSAVLSHPKQMLLLSPGNLFSSPGAFISLGLTSLFGFMGLPHILMRFFTVKDAAAARKSSFYAIAIMGYFYLLIIIIGFGAIAILMGNPDYYSEGSLRGGVNMIALHVAHFLGGDWLLGFISAVTFATILAVVAGLTLSGAATIAHDLYANGLAKAEVSEHREVLLSRIAVLGLSVISIVLGILFEHQNVVFVSTLALSVAASVNAPILLMGIYWSGLTTRGAVIGGIVGLVSSVSLIVLGPQVWVGVLGFESPLFPYAYPTLVSVPVTFIVIWLVSTTDNSERAAIDRKAFDQQFVRAETGLGIEQGVAH